MTSETRRNHVGTSCGRSIFKVKVTMQDSALTPEQRKNIRLYLRTGRVADCPWPGGPVSGGAAQHRALIEALIEEVQRRTTNERTIDMPLLDLVAYTRKKVEPMVTGLFPKSEREIVLQVLEKSVVFVTPDNFAKVLRSRIQKRTAWSVANLYLLSVGAQLLSKDAPRIVGLSEETTCYVSLEYFHQDDKFADFIVHEAAHVFHNSKREIIGLPASRRHEFLLEIDFRQRETFAYACEAYSRILELAKNRKEQLELLNEMEEEYKIKVDRVDTEKYELALREAVAARNGWKRILEICAPKPLLSQKEIMHRDQE